MIEKKYNTNIKQCKVYLNGKKVKMIRNIIIYGYKKILNS